MNTTIYWVRDLRTNKIARYRSLDAVERAVEREQYMTVHELIYWVSSRCEYEKGSIEAL